ncbi:c-type cytochrome [Methylobacter luteus]|uniref:c-type cytochrome n=1 Tax=Methylobacter luteus TaxID=415 RepID=UPI00040006E9|nr:c-type cytochrome [Methylobacter luteus]
MNIKSSLITLFFFLITGQAFAIDPVYEGPNGIRAQVFATNCLACHSSEKVGAARNGAPPNVNYDTYEATEPNAERAIVSAVEEESMPPTGSGIPKLNDEQKAAMLAWQSAGFPREATTPPPPSATDSSFDGTTLRLPVVNVGDEKFNATLDLIPLEDSPTGSGFELRSAELTTASSDNAATYTPATGIVTIPSVNLTTDGTSVGTEDAQLTLIPNSDPMRFILEEPGFPNISTEASFSFDTNILTLPVVNVGDQTFRATLRLINLETSPTGAGFVLETAELTTASSDNAATYTPETGQVILPFVDLIRNGVSEGPVSAEMQLVEDSQPLEFSLTSFTPIEQQQPPNQ